MPEITVHHLEMSRSSRVLWALEELGLDYRIERWPRNPRTLRAPPEIKRTHPVGRFPVLCIDDAVLAESGAILEELAERFDSLRPSSPAERQQYRYWLHFAEGSLMPPLLVALITGQLRTKVPWPASWITGAIGGRIDSQYTWPQLADLLAPVDAHLQAQDFFAGPRLSMADIQMSYPALAALHRVPGAAESYPALGAWAARIQARPAFQRSIERGGPLLPPA